MKNETRHFSIKNLTNSLWEISNLACKNGLNYMVDFDVRLLEGCNSLEKARADILKKYPYLALSRKTVTKISIDKFWKEVSYGFDYRGNADSGFSLSTEEEQRYQKHAMESIDMLSSYINKDTIIASIDDTNDRAFGQYEVFWGYRFIVINRDGKSLLFLGYSSD